MSVSALVRCKGMTHWVTDALEITRREEAVMLVIVCGVEGSAPRDPGAAMLVTTSEASGSIGGGALEMSALDYARTVLKDGAPSIVFEDYPLGPALGQCCGGFVRLGFYRFGVRDEDWLCEAVSALEHKQAGWIEIGLNKEAAAATFVEGALPSAEIDVEFLDTDGEVHTHKMPHVPDCTRLRIRISGDLAQVCIFGAGHVGHAMVSLLETMPAEVTWIDRREDQFPEAPGKDIVIHRTEHEIDLITSAPSGTCFLVMTHDHELDYTLVQNILSRGDAAYCGLIGSKTKRARFAQRLIRDGLNAAHVDTLICPIGGAQLTSKAPEMIALSALHEMFIAHQHYVAGLTSSNMSQGSVRVGN